MNPYDKYCQIMDELMEHDCVTHYAKEMCADCRSKYNQALALEKEYGDTLLWEQPTLSL